MKIEFEILLSIQGVLALFSFINLIKLHRFHKQMKKDIPELLSRKVHIRL